MELATTIFVTVDDKARVPEVEAEKPFEVESRRKSLPAKATRERPKIDPM